MKRIIVSSIIVSSIIGLTACGPAPKRDYDSSAKCNALGLKAGTKEFEDCVREERTSRMLKEQREEYEQRKADDEMWRKRRMN